MCCFVRSLSCRRRLFQRCVGKDSTNLEFNPGSLARVLPGFPRPVGPAITVACLTTMIPLSCWQQLNRLGSWSEGGRLRIRDGRISTACTEPRRQNALSSRVLSFVSTCHLRSINNELGSDMLGNSPSRDAPGEAIKNSRTIDFPGFG